MYKLTQVSILAILSVISMQSSYANYSNPPYEVKPNYQQSQMSYDQDLYNHSLPDTSVDNSFMMQSSNRFNQMRQANRNMIDQDRRMMRKGYDPNENYDNGDTHYVQREFSPGNQAQMMRENVRYQREYAPNEYDQGYNSGIPQSYPLNNDYSNVPMNRGSSNIDTNSAWDTMDNQTMRQSSANTDTSPRWNAQRE